MTESITPRNTSDATAAGVASQIADKVIPPVVVTSATKAIVGGITAGVVGAAGALTTALADGVISGGEWITIIVAGLVGSGIVSQSVYQATNKRVVN